MRVYFQCMYSLVVICSYVLSCCKRQRSRARTNSAREAAEAAAEAAVVMDETGEAISPCRLVYSVNPTDRCRTGRCEAGCFGLVYGPSPLKISLVSCPSILQSIQNVKLHYCRALKKSLFLIGSLSFPLKLCHLLC